MHKVLQVHTRPWIFQSNKHHTLIITSIYNLPNPLTLLHQPPSQKRYKCLIKNNIAQFWQEKLRAMIHRGESNELTSLKYFKPEYMSVLRPHPILTTAAHSYDVNKMVVQLRILSGRYRVGSLLRHFPVNTLGFVNFVGLSWKTSPIS